MSELAITLCKAPVETPAEVLAKSIVARVDFLSAKLRTLEDDIRRLWTEFENLKTGETILGCRTRKEFCETKLHRTPRAVQYLLHGRTPAVAARDSEQCSPSAPTTQRSAKCEICGNDFPSQTKWKKHLKDAHHIGDGKKRVIDTKPLSFKINKHLVGAQVGDFLVYNSSYGTCAAPIVALNDKTIIIQTGKSEKTQKTFPLNIDCGTIRGNISKNERDGIPERKPEWLHYAPAKAHAESPVVSLEELTIARRPSYDRGRTNADIINALVSRLTYIQIAVKRIAEDWDGWSKVCPKEIENLKAVTKAGIET